MSHVVKKSYFDRLTSVLGTIDVKAVAALAADIARVRLSNQTILICGNGGSAANAIHWANDFLYPVAKDGARNLRCHALTANPSVMTCLGNDIGFEQIFSRQLTTFASPEDLLIVLSGSGNSPNIIRVLETARMMGVKSWAIVGFDGGRARNLADATIHMQTDDMQIAEDAQMAICHSLVQMLAAKGSP